MAFIKKIWISYIVLLYFGVNNFSYGQFYVSPEVCVNENQPDPNNPGQSIGCSQATTFFDTLRNSVSWNWDFGDGFTANTRDPKHFYNTPGTFIVNLRNVDNNGVINNFTKTLTVGTYPNQPKFNDKVDTDTTVCDGSTLKLNPFKGSLGGNNYEYLWFPNGETTSTIDVDTSGCYSVEVKDKTTGCSRSARIKVKFCLQEVPSSSVIEKKYLKGGIIIEYREAAGDPLPIDSLSSEGELTAEVDYTSVTTASELSKKHSLSSEGANSIVYDSQGNLVLYSDGIKVYSGEDETEIKMLDGSTYTGLNGISTSAIYLIPKNSCNTCNYQEYYLFSVNANGLLSYSVIDMRYNNKKGAITETNVPVLFPVSQNLTVISNFDETGYIIYGKETGTNTIQITTLDTLGVNTQNQAIGSINSQASNNSYAVSLDGRKLAQGLVIGGQNYVEIFDIDPLGNRLGNPLLIDLKIAAPPTVFGLSFSASGGLLYVSLSGDPTLGERSSFIQVPLLLEDPTLISNNINLIASSNTEKYGAVNTAPVNVDNPQVYLSIVGKNYLPFVNNPEVVGNAIAVGYSEVTASLSSVPLSGPVGEFFTNQVKTPQEQDGDGFSANYSGNCFNAPSVLTTQGVCSPMRSEVTWIFEDGTEKEGLSVSYVFPKLGWNNIKIKVKIFNPSPTAGVVNSQVVNKLLETECITKEFDARIYIKPSPVIDLPDKLYICFEEFEKKAVGPKTSGGNSFKFEWYTSKDVQVGKDSIYIFDIPSFGNPYKLKVINNFECEAEDKVDVLEGCEPALFVPDVFTPNGDSLNDTFEVTPAYITDFDFKVFNRWGEMVFNSKNPEIKWDGRYKGKVFANQLYPYTINYKSKYFPERGTLQTRGSILILK